jgi:hypothetical protein
MGVAGISISAIAYSSEYQGLPPPEDCERRNREPCVDYYASIEDFGVSAEEG